MEYDQSTLDLIASQLEDSIESARDLLAAFQEVHSKDDGSPILDASSLPASPDVIRKAIVVVACVSDDAPNVEDIAKELISSWIALEFYGDPRMAPCSDHAVRSRSMSPQRSQLAGNERAAKIALERFCAAPDAPLENEWLELTTAEYKRQLASMDCRIDSLKYFSKGTIPDEFFLRMKNSGPSSATPSPPRGCASALAGIALLGAMATRFLAMH